MDILDLLRGTSIFSDCTDEDLGRLCEVARMREFPGGQRLFSLGDTASELMVIASGEVQLELPVSVLGEIHNIAFETKGRGSVVGWSALAVPNRFTLSGRAVGDTSVVTFHQDDLEDVFTADPALGLRLLKKVLSLARLRLDHTHAMWVQEIQQGLDERYR